MKKIRRNKTIDKLYLAIIIILTIIILLLLGFNLFNNKDYETKRIDDRDADEFNIRISCGCIDPENCNNNNTPVEPTDNTNKETNNTPKQKKCNKNDFRVIHVDENGELIPVIDEETEEEEEEPPTIINGRIYVDDVNGDYLYHQTLPIFNNDFFGGTNKIAPGISGTYKFKVHNESDTSLKYYFKLTEESQYKVNLKYRLKKGDEYVLGGENLWVSAYSLETEFANIDIDGFDSYTLEWKWFDDDSEDYKAGKYMTEEYKLNITIHIESI